MNELKTKNLKANIPLIIIFTLVAIVFLALSVPPLIKSLQTPIPLEEVDYSVEDLEGLYVSGTLPFIYDWYCETTEDGNTVSREYLIDGGEEYYIGMKVMKKDMPRAEALLQACYDYYDGLDDGTAVMNAQYEVKGTLTKMPADSIQYYFDYVDWNNLPADEQPLFRTYYLEVNKIDGFDIEGAIVFLVLGLIFILTSVIIVVYTMSGSQQKRIKQYIAKSANPDMTKEKVDNFLNNTPWVNNLKVNIDFICGTSAGDTAFGETSKLVWAYMHTTTHKRNFITIATTYELVLTFADRSQQKVVMRSENDALQNLSRLEQYCPQAILGYSDELAKMYRKDFAGFLNIKYNAANQMVN